MAHCTIEGTVVLAQESRFQLTDDHGVAHLFVLSHSAAAEPPDLVRLQHDQTRIRVRWAEAPKLKARIAHRLDLCPATARAS